VSTTASKHQNFVGGEWVDATGGETMEVLNPATGETIAEVPRSSAEDVDRAVQSAKKALPEWLETTPGERAEMLLKLADALEQHGDEIAELESQNVGKPLSYAKDEIPVAVDNIRDIGRALNAARKLQFGTVWINDHIPLVSEMPHGGFKQSGYGKDLSAYSLEDYTQIKHVMAKLD
jgi:acyl-CoA reductase-like NAD-dependent aldehyde dehydrogenase